MTNTSLAIVRVGIAQFFGGTTYVPLARAYRGSSPLQGAGLSTVRAYRSKRLSDVDYTIQQAAGRGMGAYMVVEMPTNEEFRRTGPAQGPGQTQPAGRKDIVYDVLLHTYHLASQEYAEDAEADVDALVEAMKGLIRSDVTLGSTPGVFQAGESKKGIKTTVSPTGVVQEHERTYIRFAFEAQVQIVA